MGTPVEFRFIAASREIAEDIAAQYGGVARPVDGHPGQYEAVATITEELPEDTHGEVA
jgi:hypothetical protein